MERDPVTIFDSDWSCPHCETENKATNRFCKTCGKPRFELAAEFGKKSVYSVMALYFLLLLAILFIAWAKPGGDGWVGELYGTLILAVITLIFVLFDPQDFLRYIFPRNIKWKILALIVLITPLFSFAVSNLANWVNREFFDVSLDGFEQLYDAPNPLLFGIFFTAVCPGIFEELAFRGVIFSRGKGIFSLKQTIWISSILFTFLHLAVLSFIWIMPFALVLGYLRARYRTTFYGMCIHFLHNFTAVMLSYYHWGNFL